MGAKSRPIIGIPVYDEHTNQIRWAEERGLGVLARNTREVLTAIGRIGDDPGGFEQRLGDFSDNFDGDGAKNTAKIASEILEKR